MRSLRRRSVARFVLVLGLFFGHAALPARAADDDAKNKPFREPGIEYIEHRSAYIQWLAGALIIAACLFVAFKNPHRSHLD